MRFKEGDKVEFIGQGELKQGVVTEIKAKLAARNEVQA